MKPKEVLEKWIDCFNKADAYHIAELYATNAVNHQVANDPIIGKESIYKMVSIRPRACFFPLFSFLPLWLHYNLNPLCVQY